MNKQLMISVIDAAKKQLNLGNSELSLKLGHNRNYISRVLHQENPTPEQMTKVVDKVKALIGEQKESLPEFKHTPIADAVMVSKDEYDKLKESNANLFNELSIRDFQINKFKKELNHKNQVLDKRNDLYRKLELECKDKDEAIKLQLENVASKILAINELEVDIKHISEAHDILVNKKINLELQLKTTQQKFVDVVDQKDSEIKKLKNDCNHATNQYQGRREQVVRLNEKVKKQKLIYMIIIAILFIASIVGFSS